MNLLTWLWVGAVVVLLFGAVIFVHELGHFLMARRCGLKVEGFSIGFGPKIIGWKRQGIEYAWRWIPAGGYVKLPQMVTSETLEGKSEAEKLPPVSAWAKILVAVAGPLMNAVFAFVLATIIYFVGLPVLVDPAIIGQVAPNSPEAKLGLRPGDRVVAVNGHMVKSWEDVQMTVALARTNVLPVKIERDGQLTTYYLTARFNDQLGLKLLDLEPSAHPVIETVFAGSAAEQAGLKRGDEILSFDGVPVVGQHQLTNLVQQRPGEPSQTEVIRQSQRLQFTVTPKFNPATKTFVLGIGIVPSTKTVYQLQRPGPLPWKLVGQAWGQISGTITALAHSKQTGVGVGDLSGPPGILAALAAETKADYRLALRFMILLNLSLVVLNLLPVPVLDGGHVALALVERLRGRPLSQRFQEYATTVFAALLISFMLYVSFNDIKRWPLFRSLLSQQVQIESGAGASNAPAPAK